MILLYCVFQQRTMNAIQKEAGVIPLEEGAVGVRRMEGEGKETKEAAARPNYPRCDDS